MPGNTMRWAAGYMQPWSASMRPQRNAGEYRLRHVADDRVVPASMRPQRNAGEYDALGRRIYAALVGFNEAPAKCRGIPPAPRGR